MIDNQKLQKASQKNRTAITRFMRDIVRIPSYSCQEREVVHRIAEEMNLVGFDKVFLDKMGNCIGKIGKGKTVILVDGHIDTVQVTPSQKWAVNPFGGVIKNNRIYGRGAADQKGATPAMVYAGKLIKELDLEDDFTFYVSCTCQEEDCDGLPILHIVQKEKIKPDYVVITDSTDMKLHRGHRGRMEIKITMKGKSCHGSMPQLGINAVYKMAPLIQEIEELNKTLHFDPFLGKGTVVVSKIECQTPSLNAVPDECVIYLDRRLTQGETKELALNQIRKLPHAKSAKVELLQYEATAWTGLKVGQEKYFPTWVTPENHPLVIAGLEAGKYALGKKPPLTRWTFSTNGVASAGRLKIPTIGFGPGKEELAHTVKEYVEIEDMVKASIFYATLPKILVQKNQ
jgi:putative selenium metabolism hydrolase